MQRYNTFHHIHKALRTLLYDAALCLQQTDFTTADQCSAAVEKVVAALELFKEQTHNEDCSVLPAIEMFEPSVADAFRQEHEKARQIANALHQTLAEWYRYKQEEKIRIGNELTHAFTQFLVFNLNHMAKEEVLNVFLWRYYSDGEIKKMEMTMRKNMTPEKQSFHKNAVRA